MRETFSPARLLILLATALLVGLVAPSHLLAAPEKDQAQISDARVNQILAKLNQTATELHLKPLGPSHLASTRKTERTEEENEQDTISGATVELGAPGWDFTFRKSDGRLLNFQLLAMNDVPQPDKLQWTEAKAIEIGTAFLKVLAGPFEAQLGKPTAQYVDPYGQEAKIRHGYWEVTWPRVDSKGHVFYFDGVSISIPEGYGVSGAAINLTTPFTEEKSEPMTQSEAIAKARASKPPGRNFPAYSSSDKLIENKFMKAELAVVIPQKNADWTQESVKGLGNRLAWVIWFQPIHSEARPHEWYNDSFSVWVDAHNGTILGTEGWL